jgi:hypothetical protein
MVKTCPAILSPSTGARGSGAQCSRAVMAALMNVWRARASPGTRMNEAQGGPINVPSRRTLKSRMTKAPFAAGGGVQQARIAAPTSFMVRSVVAACACVAVRDRRLMTRMVLKARTIPCPAPVEGGAYAAIFNWRRIQCPTLYPHLCNAASERGLPGSPLATMGPRQTVKFGKLT